LSAEAVGRCGRQHQDGKYACNREQSREAQRLLQWLDPACGGPGLTAELNLSNVKEFVDSDFVGGSGLWGLAGRGRLALDQCPARRTRGGARNAPGEPFQSRTDCKYSDAANQRRLDGPRHSR
jgi:hypothetical protein